MVTFEATTLASGKTVMMARPVPAMAAVAATQPQKPAVQAVAVSAVSATAPIAQIRYVDPDIAAQIVAIRPPQDGLPREKITVPVAPTVDVIDDALFTDPADPNKRFYLPRYALAEERTASGQPRYAIALRAAGPEWTLSVRLRKAAPPSLGDAARTAAEIKHSIAVILRHKLIVAGAPTAVSENVFGESAADGDTVVTSLRVQTLAQRDSIVRALSDPQSGTQLVVRRSIDVAIPVPQRQPAPLPPHPILVQEHGPVLAGGTQKLPPHPILVRDHRPVLAGGAQKRMLIARDVQPIKRVPPPPPPPPPRQPPPPAPPPVPLFRQVTRVLDAIADPTDFTFPMVLHPYVYGDIAAPSGATQSLVRQTVAWRGTNQSYYQHPYDTWLFYYLPDSFKLVRRPVKPREPLMQLRYVPAPDGAASDPLAASRAVLDYIAYPVVDMERLADAAARFKPLVAMPLPPGIDGPQFQPFVAAPDRLKLRLRLPGAAGYVERPQASVNLRSGIKDTLDLSLPEFQSVFDALFGAGLTLFTGEVALDLGDGAGESIPFSARLEDMTGDVVEFSATPEGTGVRVTVTNVIESPISLKGLPATLTRGGQSAPAMLSNADFANPVQLAPGAAVQVVMTPTSPLPDGAATSVALDLSNILVTPDRAAIYGEILDPTTPTAFSRTVHVVTAETRFSAGAAAPSRIVVEFDGGGAVDLHPGHVEGDALVKRPIEDFVLRNGSTGSYRYRLQTLPTNGGAPVIGEWQEASSDFLLI
jgi:hypothetical protein